MSISLVVSKPDKHKPSSVMVEQTRDFVYVKDIVRANLAAISCPPNNIVNISTGESTSVNDLAQTMMDINHSWVEADYKPERPGDIPRSLLSRKFAFNMMGWEPVYDLEAGLREMLTK